MKRILIIILDGLGIGELPDAVEYGDSGSNTLKNMADAVEGLNLSNLEMLGLGLIDHFQGMKRPDEIKGFYGKMAEASKAKDTTSGHWEMMGVTVHEPFKSQSREKFWGIALHQGQRL
jgi:phosphopentomutase